MGGGGTPFILGYKINEFNIDDDIIIEEILSQIGDIQSCFEIDTKRKILILKFKDEASKNKVKSKEIKFEKK
ncbi:hypothetical protein AYI70_g3873 [Smittium culicis]|uniref:Uncharacterized protein n=1 Tax=Smittium culicis TaxID=133412 RepID=A0A1R1Y1M8_9FUNG|nr:hypothetical protein AYI70_g3873 [Smittium culicis]